MIVLDTDVLIDFLRKQEPTTSFLMKLHAQGAHLATTSINAAELLRGRPQSSESLGKVEKLLTALEEVPFGPQAARRYGEIMAGLDRSGKAPATSDGLIAAATLAAGGRLVTRNARDFLRIPGLEVVVPKA